MITIATTGGREATTTMSFVAPDAWSSKLAKYKVDIKHWKISLTCIEITVNYLIVHVCY